MKADEFIKKQKPIRDKAGTIPFYIKDGQLFMYFMIPSDPKRGTHDPQIAKGKVEEGEPVQAAAFREASEEIGLLKENVKDFFFVSSSIVTGLDETYKLAVYAAEIIDPLAFGPTDFETADRVWMTPNQFQINGRANHRPIVNQAAQKILHADGRGQGI